mgnify:CR=1 FL=1
MKKVSLVVLDSTRKESLKKLRKLGLVHLETIEGRGSVLASYKESSQETDKAISILEEIKLPKKSVVKPVELSKEESRDKAKHILSLSEKKKSLLDSITQNTLELDRLSKWGSVNPEDFAFLSQKGLYLYMYEIPQEKYALIGQDVRTVVVNTAQKTTRFLLLSEEEVLERPASLPPEAYAVPLPEKSNKTLTDEIRLAEQEITRIEKELLESKKFEKALHAYKTLLSGDIEFETVYSGMSRENLEEETENEESEGEVRLAWLTGYVPLPELENLKASCKENEWALAYTDPADDDPVPTKLKNGKIVSLIYPLMDFLDVTPGYHEFDISGWFLLFFCIFFAMIFGDACYGALIALLGLFILAKSKKGSRSLPTLIIVLGLFTSAWGVMTCSWFGIEPSKLPAWMTDISCRPFSKALLSREMSSQAAEDLANTNQKIFCFTLALIQLSVAHIKLFFKDIKSLKCLADFGDLIKLWGMFYLVMSMVVDSTAYPMVAGSDPIVMFGITFPAILPTVCIGMIGVGFVFSFIFANYEGSVGKSILESLKNIISVLLGVVNVFSDIVSYIRLWAVALAGAAISETVNSMALGIFGGAGTFVAKLIFAVLMVALLVFGHGLNMILNVLSVIVHGVRLNTLEFSQHLGMAWSGTKYKPFSEK